MKEMLSRSIVSQLGQDCLAVSGELIEVATTPCAWGGPRESEAAFASKDFVDRFQGPLPLVGHMDVLLINWFLARKLVTRARHHPAQALAPGAHLARALVRGSGLRGGERCVADS